MRFLRRRPKPAPRPEVCPEFGIRVTLRKGDKLVGRDGKGHIRITQVTADRVDETEMFRLTGVHVRHQPRSR